MTATTADLHAKILSFLGTAFSLEGVQTIVRVDLGYSPPGGYRVDPLKSWQPESHPDLFGIVPELKDKQLVFVERLATEILELAENHADSYGVGRHRFVLRTAQHMGGRQVHAFVILPSFDGSDEQQLALTQGGAGMGGAGDALVPTSTGLIAQLMRHLEVRDRNAQITLQSYMGAINHHTQQMRDENTELRAQIAAMNKDRAESWKLIEEARSTEHSRQIEAQLVVGKEERKTMAAKKIVNLLPVFMSKWLGSGKGKDGEPIAPKSPLGKAAAKLLGSLTGDQRDALGGILSMEQQIALSEVVEVVKNGDSPLLPTMLNDLISSMKPAQVQAIMAEFSSEQATLFVTMIQLAQAQAEAASEAPANGTALSTTTTEAS